MTKFVIPIQDNDGHIGRAGIPVAAATADANLTAIFNAVAALSIGNAQDAKLLTSENKDVGVAGPAASPSARKNVKFRVRWQESVSGLVRSTTISSADMSLVPGTSQLTTASGVGATLKAAIEADGEDPDTGGTLTVLDITVVE